MITYAEFTNRGSREYNEDSLAVYENKDMKCFVLCDGLGGMGMGDVASKIVVEKFGSQFKKIDEAVNFLGQTFLDSQAAILDKQAELRKGHQMKTTAVALTTDTDTAYIGHVGDSRVYVFRKNKVKCRTLDHSIPQMLVISKRLKEKDIRNHPDRNILLRVMGIEWEEPMYELMQPLPLKKCQAFLLCSDGFWELIDEKDMCDTLKTSDSVEEWIARMSDIVRVNGMGKNMDNYSAIAVWNV